MRVLQVNVAEVNHTRVYEHWLRLVLSDFTDRVCC